ncbi:MAG: hypothetical protein R3D71_05985 [Rickettsiales bacterium]
MDLKINIASFEEGWNLQRAVLSAVKKEGFNINEMQGEDALQKLIDIVLTINCDIEVNEALWICLRRCTYNGEKITKDKFEDAESRKDYMMVAFKCLEMNLEPFTDGLLSVFKALSGNPQIIQKLQ